MSYPEDPRPGDGANASDPRGVETQPQGVLGTLVRGFRRHVRTWPGRYVEMRIEARTEKRD
ncbi:hypothetical protein GCM10028857_23140 [Salinarchaeum chitinilyticum]